MISVIKWAWQAKPDTPAEKLVLVSLANSTFQTPREDIAVVGVRALRGTACDMTPAELDAFVNALSGGYLYPSPGNDPIGNEEYGPTGRNLYGIDRERTTTPESFAV